MTTNTDFEFFSSMKVAKTEKNKTANSNLQKFIILTWYFHFLCLSSGGLETENPGKMKKKMSRISIITSSFSRDMNNNLVTEHEE